MLYNHVVGKQTIECYTIMFQENKENVKLLLSLADGFVAKGNMHASNIRAWCAAVDKRYKDFSGRMEKYRIKLEKTLGVHQEEEVELPFRKYFDKVFLNITPPTSFQLSHWLKQCHMTQASHPILIFWLPRIFRIGQQNALYLIIPLFSAAL